MTEPHEVDAHLDEALVREIKSYVTDVVEAAKVAPYPRGELTRTFSRLVQWAVELGLPIDRETVLSERSISIFIANGLPHYTDAGRANLRSQLHAMRTALDGVQKPEPLSSADPSAPYSRADIRRLRSWADAQATEEYRRDAMSILCLGIGAGLSAGEIAQLRGDGVRIDTHGVQIFVSSGRVRNVQVRREWEGPLVDHAASASAESYFIRSERKKEPRNFLSNLIDRSSGPGFRPQSQRMRATWIVEHLTSGTPMRVLMEAAGVESLEAFTRFMRFVPTLPTHRARGLLRSTNSFAR